MVEFKPIVKTYYEFLEEGKCMTLKCKSCGKVIYPPVPVCDACFEMETEWVELSGKATLLSGGEIPRHFLWDSLKAYGEVKFGEVRLAEGPEISAPVLGLDGNDVEISARCPLPLEMIIVQDNGFKTIAFKVAEN